MPFSPELDGIKTSLTGIAHLLRDQQLEMPAYQRSYSWGIEQVEAFWSDLRAALVAEQPVYFLGTVVLTSGDGDRSTVIDGQQRLATTSMLIAAIRESFRKKSDDVSADQVSAQYLQSASLLRQRTEPRLLLNAADRGFYERYVVQAQPGIELDLPRSNLRIKKAYDYLVQRVWDDISSAGPYWRDRLIAWIQLLDMRARVIAVTVRDDADAFLIFETLNDRGLALTVADVVKNYLFGLCRNSISEAEQKWVVAVQALDRAGVSSQLTTFLRHWWTSTSGATRERDLYRRIRDEIHTQSAAMAALDSLAEAAPAYAAIVNPDLEFWNSFDPDLRSSVKVLADLGLEQNRPLLLAGVLHLDERELAQLVRGLISWSVRGLVVGGIGGGTTERYFAEAAVAVSQAKAVNAAQVLRQLEPIVPGDAEFSEQFAIRRVQRVGLLKYYLRALEAGDSVPAVKEPRQTVTHIVTASILGSIQINDADQQQLQRIGNYVLLDETEARKLKSDGELRFAAASDYATDWVDWVNRGIDRRQRALASLALKIWPREPQ